VKGVLEAIAGIEMVDGIADRLAGARALAQGFRLLPEPADEVGSIGRLEGILSVLLHQVGPEERATIARFPDRDGDVVQVVVDFAEKSGGTAQGRIDIEVAVNLVLHGAGLTFAHELSPGSATAADSREDRVDVRVFNVVKQLVAQNGARAGPGPVDVTGRRHPDARKTGQPVVAVSVTFIAVIDVDVAVARKIRRLEPQLRIPPVVTTRISDWATGFKVEGKKVLQTLQQRIVIRRPGRRIHVDDVVGVETEQGGIDVGRNRCGRPGKGHRRAPNHGESEGGTEGETQEGDHRGASTDPNCPQSLHNAPAGYGSPCTSSELQSDALPNILPRGNKKGSE
jgi:hypothetical protein